MWLKKQQQSLPKCQSMQWVIVFITFWANFKLIKSNRKQQKRSLNKQPATPLDLGCVLCVFECLCTFVSVSCVCVRGSDLLLIEPWHVMGRVFYIIRLTLMCLIWTMIGGTRWGARLERDLTFLIGTTMWLMACVVCCDSKSTQRSLADL